ncbi:hypothetical protein BISA_2085 [Bifidobacterium saguini DSM 23967]|uniref:Uncharacterized protein n=1 Tax=Bifidobacterium saguini DSM 23967 TaxID=1437607 RepID=A0A087D6H2_9BIFI|nr:hypothetical protein [Bifidobacterium saguini]KFI91122.1 hypothetical protein BISA_2085 [Bifidobacterium saguini DSM 23967]
MTSDTYPNSLAVDQAIKSAAKREHQISPSRSINDIIRQTYYD